MLPLFMYLQCSFWRQIERISYFVLPVFTTVLMGAEFLAEVLLFKNPYFSLGFFCLSRSCHLAGGKLHLVQTFNEELSFCL